MAHYYPSSGEQDTCQARHLREVDLEACRARTNNLGRDRIIVIQRAQSVFSMPIQEAFLTAGPRANRPTY
jgi:hypothetical protein